VNLHDLLTQPNPHKEEQPYARQRIVPSQPAGVEPGKVYLGADVGEVDYSGVAPRPGDQVVIQGSTARRIVVTGQGIPPMHAPTFAETCICKCPSRDGTIVWANPIQTGPYIVIMDGNGAFKQTLNPPQIFRIAGVAVDSASPFTMYVLDDRTRLNNFKRDISPDTQIAGVSTYALHIFVNSGASYSWSGVVEMPDPGLPSPPFFINDLDWVTRDISGGDGLNDPPSAYPTNCMSVIDGILHITMSKLPARYLTFNGSSFITHNLTFGGINYSKGLRGSIVTRLTRPALASRRYVLAWLGFGGFSEDGSGSYEVLEFNTANQITKRLSNDAILKSPTALQSVCNRLLLLNTNFYGRTEDGTSASLNGSLIQSGSPP
jgi:hypothetical protein